MKNITDHILHLADNNLILAQRNAEWCAHGPVLEQDIAITNITLDILGQARLLFQHAASLLNLQKNGAVTEDTLAYLRTEREFKNILLVEQPNGDWAHTILRQYLFSQFQFLLYRQLEKHSDEQIAAIATKSLKEILYHVKWSSEWVLRLGDGTTESNARMRTAIDDFWMYTEEFFIPASYEYDLPLADIKKEWLIEVEKIFHEAGLPIPENTFMQTGGKNGVHTEQLGYLLADLQYLQRTYPGAEW
jgi:ring-1,2-phenylacetyl-CoA epoxidase subunit PaaC